MVKLASFSREGGLVARKVVVPNNKKMEVDIMTGNYRSGRKAKPCNAGAAVGGGIPRPPTYLSEGERIEWRRVAKLLRGAGIITSLDTTVLAAYCVLHSRWLEAEEHIDSEGAVLSGRDGLKTSPWARIARQAADQMLRVMAELGMTPASRSRIPRKEKEKARPRRIPLVSDDPRDLLEGK